MSAPAASGGRLNQTVLKGIKPFNERASTACFYVCSSSLLRSGTWERRRTDLEQTQKTRRSLPSARQDKRLQKVAAALEATVPAGLIRMQANSLPRRELLVADLPQVTVAAEVDSAGT